MEPSPDDMDAELDAKTAEMALKLAEIKAIRDQKRSADQLPAEKPSSNGPDGRFLPGHKASKGRGNPLAGEVQIRRAVLMETISVEDFRLVVLKLLELAKRGNMEAIKEVVTRVLGRPLEADIFDKVATLEALVKQIEDEMAERQSEQPKMRITTH